VRSFEQAIATGNRDQESLELTRRNALPRALASDLSLRVFHRPLGGLILTNVDTLADRDPTNNFFTRALTYNPDGLLNGAETLTIVGNYVYVGCVIMETAIRVHVGFRLISCLPPPETKRQN
jgi:hypothetical protein